MELLQAEQMAHTLMRKHGLSPKWKFKFDRAVQRFGSCNWRRKVITLSAHLVSLNGVSQVKDTILHEIAHALAPSNAGHGEKWQAIARAIGCNAQRCYGDEVVSPKLKFRGICPTCRRSIHRNRRRRVSCGRCDRKYNPRHLFVWTEV